MPGKLPHVQQAGIFFCGFFEYDSYKLQEAAFIDDFDYSKYFEQNKSYFTQKYYPNWLQTLYPQSANHLSDMGMFPLSGNHIFKKDVSSLAGLQITTKGEDIPFSITKMELHLFRSRLGVFSIKIDVPHNHLSFESISNLIFTLRNTTDNPSYVNNNPLLTIIEKDLLYYICNDVKTWRQFNPQLKFFLNLDTSSAFESNEQWNQVITDLATVKPLGAANNDGLFDLHPEYYNRLIENNILFIYNNWRTIFLFDAVVRISINLKEVDKNNMWDNEYITIYLFTLFIRLYLFRVNNELAQISSGSIQAAQIRDEFIKFRHDFDLSQISYKFLPNEIYNKLLSTLDIQAEMSKLDEKINRIDTAIQEVQENRIEKLLAFMVFITVFSIILDGTNLLLVEFNIQPAHSRYTNYFRIFSAFLFVIFSIAGFVIYRRWKKRKSIL